jgi:PAS domain S-box-containing protein
MPLHLADTKTILIVEDERLVAQDLQQSLQTIGYDVPATVASAEDAIASTSARCPDLVLMDIHIQGERDGIETAHLLRERFDVPVVYLTAHADKETVERAQKTEPFGYLLKPVSPQSLSSTVEIALYKHEMERRLRERERWSATMLRSIGDAVVSTDASGMITFMNPVAETMTGWHLEEAKGRPLASLVRVMEKITGQAIEDPVDRAGRGKLATPFKMFSAPEGEAVAISDSASPLVDQAGAVIGTVWVIRDVSEQHRLRRQLELADRLSSLGTMAAGIAHEVNNPLSILMGTLEAAHTELEDHQGELHGAPWALQIESAVSKALEVADRIKAIVADLRSFGRPAAELSDRADVARVVEWALQMTSHEVKPRARVVKNFVKVPAVCGNETRLGQVFLNLLMNAAQAMESDRPDINEIRIAIGTNHQGHVEVDIRDTGKGMSEAVMKRIFDPFFTTKDLNKGTGLGLGVCHSIVTSLGGEIHVESESGKGSLFRVTLPVARSETALLEAQPGVAQVELRGTIMVIDDESDLRNIIQSTLRKGHAVVAPATSREALEILKDGTQFDVILCDIMMPDVTGIEIYEELLRIRPEQARRMAFMSGGAFTARAIDFLKSVNNPKIDKPFRPRDLRQRVQELLVEWGTVAATPTS